MNLQKQVTLKNKNVRNLVLSLISAALFSIPWCGGGVFSLFLAFIPLLIIADSSNKKTLFFWSSFTITAWTIATTYWVAYATIWGVVAASVASIVIFSVPFFTYKIVRAKAPKALAYTVFVTAWIACEYLYLHNEQVSHPWLMLGNGFANSVKFIQWYEYFGALGGSLWVLIVNLIAYESLSNSSKKLAITAVSFIAIPITISMVMYYTYEEKHDPISVSVIQPNIDPYKDKFDGMSQYEQDNLIQSLIKKSPKNINYILAPETSTSGVNIDYSIQNRSVRSYSELMRSNYPNSELIIGASMHRLYPQSDELPTPTARKSANGYYDGINGSLLISGSDKENQTYIKSKLVIGVEMVPCPEILNKIKFGSIDLGGMSGALLTPKEITNYKSTINNREILTASTICYESIYGDFMTKFIRKGAEVIFVITNDGWWGDTFGYKQHFAFSRLRAIETRRSVARSANTGISGFVNQRGDVLETLGWDKRGILTADINLNDKLTFYSIYGDSVGRVSSYIFILSLLYFIAYINKKKSHLN